MSLANSEKEQSKQGQEAEEKRTVPLRAMAHPLRLRILSVLTRTAMGASDVAAELDIENSLASYHLRELASAGLIEVVERDEDAERPVGRPPILYRYVLDYEDRLDRSEGRDAVFALMVQDLTRRFAAMQSRHRIVDGEFWLSEETYKEICDLADRMSELMHDRALPPRTEGAFHASITVSVFGL